MNSFVLKIESIFRTRKSAVKSLSFSKIFDFSHFDFLKTITRRLKIKINRTIKLKKIRIIDA